MTRRDVALITLLYVLWLAAAYLINIVTTGARTPQMVFDNWVRFDGIYFRVLAEHGYAEASEIIRPQQGFPFLTAVFPLFPLLIRLAAPLTGGDYSLASVVVPQVLSWLVLLALFRLARRDFSRTVAYGAVLSLLTYPVFYFLTAPYSETLFLLLVILTFDLYRRKRLWVAGLAGALVAATRIVGAPLLVGTLLLEAAYKGWRAQRQPKGDFRLANYAFTLIMPLGLLSYMLFQWWEFANPLMFLRGHASSEWKVGFDLLGPVRGLLLPFYSLFARDWASEAFRTNLFNAAFLYAALGIAIYAWRKLPLSYALYGALALIVPTFTGSLISMPRFLLISFPFFLGMGHLYAARPRLRLLLVVLAAGGLVATHLFFRTVFLG